MKRLFLFLAAGCILPVTAFCQLEKGNLMGPFSVGITYYHQDQKDLGFKVNDFSVSLTDALGIFVIDRLAVGPGLTFSLEDFHSYGSSAGGEQYNFSYSILFDPFVRYYFAKNGKLAWFGQVNGAIGYGQNIWKNINETETQHFKNNVLKYGGSAGMGMTFFFNQSIGLETMLAYNFLKSDWVDKEPESDFKYSNIMNTISLNVGLAFYLATK
ncbi:MAG TPA: hypothetical protein VMC08_01170 [Bacteroidales bacterium]|nr:hypothetical protein [Bacteroidales bacterium]